MRNRDYIEVLFRAFSPQITPWRLTKIRVWMTCFGVALLLFEAWPVLGQPAGKLPRPVGYVNDFAHVMSPAAIARLNRACGKVEQQTHDRIDVVTVQTTGRKPIEQYATELQLAWKVGNRDVMVIVDVRQRQRWIAAESGLETVFSPAQLGKISGAMVPMLRSNDFDGAMSLAVKDLAAGMARQTVGVAAEVPAENRWLKPVTWGLTVLLIASFGVWVYASGLAEAIWRRMNQSMGRERQ